MTDHSLKTLQKILQADCNSNFTRFSMAYLVYKALRIVLSY